MAKRNAAESLLAGGIQMAKSVKFVAPEHWDPLMWLENPIFADLCALFPLTQCHDFPSVATLDQWRLTFTPEVPVCFVENAQLAADGRYYEAFIYDTQQVPTRHPNWHDLFGALIWCLFPKTKKLLNRLHVHEMQHHGTTQRTLLRNKLTLLDECGVLVLYRPEAAHVVALMQNHQWSEAFVHQRHLWQGQSSEPGIAPMMFGHANYEMATRPYIGLTGKMLALAVPPDFFRQTLRQRIDFIDTALSEQIANLNILVNPLQLTPLPILGVPGWYEQNINPDFYQNAGYFRPKRTAKVQE